MGAGRPSYYKRPRPGERLGLSGDGLRRPSRAHSLLRPLIKDNTPAMPVAFYDGATGGGRVDVNVGE